MKDLIIVKQLPVIEEKLMALKSEITEKVENAKALVCNEETVKAVKDVRASLNKDFKELEEQRKSVKNLVLAPYEQFESVYKECVTELFKSADVDLKNKIDATESDLKAQKEQEIKEYFEEYKTAKNIDFISFEQAKINVTLSASKKSLKEQAKNYIDKIYSDLDVISIQDHKDEMLVEYKSNGYDCNKAITTVLNRIALIEREKEIQEKQKAEAEQIQQNIENIQKAIEPEIAAPISAPVVEEKEYVVNFKVIATREKLIELKQFLNEKGYKYE
jgi:hypothetical protein